MIPANVSPTPLMLTCRVRMAHSSRSLSIVSAMAWSSASSWDVKCWIVALASDSALSMPLVLRFVHSVRRAGPDRLEFAQSPQSRRGWGPGAGLEQLGVIADVRGVDL